VVDDLLMCKTVAVILHHLQLPDNFLVPCANLNKPLVFVGLLQVLKQNDDKSVQSWETKTKLDAKLPRGLETHSSYCSAATKVY
jgi:hypothetical protein